MLVVGPVINFLPWYSYYRNITIVFAPFEDGHDCVGYLTDQLSRGPLHGIWVDSPAFLSPLSNQVR